MNISTTNTYICAHFIVPYDMTPMATGVYLCHGWAVNARRRPHYAASFRSIFLQYGACWCQRNHSRFMYVHIRIAMHPHHHTHLKPATLQQLAGIGHSICPHRNVTQCCLYEFSSSCYCNRWRCCCCCWYYYWLTSGPFNHLAG